MKLIKSVGLATLALAALTACDRRGQDDKINNTSLGTGASQIQSSRDGSDLPSSVQQEEAYPSNVDRNAAGAAGAVDYSDESTESGSGAAVDDETIIDDETATGSGAAADEEWKDQEMGEEDLNRQEEEYTGDTTDSSFPQESDNVKYLDNTSSEPDLRRQEKGIPIGREPGFIDNTSSEGNPNQL